MIFDTTQPPDPKWTHGQEYEWARCEPNGLETPRAGYEIAGNRPQKPRGAMDVGCPSVLPGERVSAGFWMPATICSAALGLTHCS
jgi:hypothetical protein